MAHFAVLGFRYMGVEERGNMGIGEDVLVTEEGAVYLGEPQTELIMK